MFDEGRSVGPAGRSLMLNETAISFPVSGRGMPAVASVTPGTVFRRSISWSMKSTCASVE